jgi:hypothetical protein
MGKIKQKLKNKSGESISEVLVASLVVAMAFVMAANLISISYHAIQKTDDSLSTYYTERNAFEEGSSDDTSTGTIAVSGSGTASINQSGINVTISSETVGSGDTAKQYVSYEKAGS